MLREDQEQNENGLGVMYRQSGQGHIRLQPNPVGIDDQARLSGPIVFSGGTGSSGRWS
jgi:hypothetical protein